MLLVVSSARSESTLDSRSSPTTETVYTSDDPLGPLGLPRKDPKFEGEVIAVGRSSIFAITTVGHRFIRSQDLGATWQSVDYADRTWGKVSSIAIDSAGNGLLVHLPKRLFVTHDDGATWKPMAFSGMERGRAVRDGEGHVFYDDGVSGSPTAKLVGNALVLTSQRPAPLPTHPIAPSSGRRFHVTTLVAGDHVIDVQDIRTVLERAFNFQSTKMGDSAGLPIAHPEIVGEAVSQAIGGWGNTLLYLRNDANAMHDGGQAAGRTSTVFWSSDFGVTWSQDATLEGSAPDRVAVGPKGWAFINPLVGPDAASTYPKVRPADATVFEDVPMFLTFPYFVFDERRDVVYAIAPPDVFASPLSKNEFGRTQMRVVGTLESGSVDDDGTLRVFAHEEGTEGWSVYSRDATGNNLPMEFLPLDHDTVEHVDDVSFAGAHGLLLANDRAWETANGGVSWVRVAHDGGRLASCSSVGCWIDGDARVGWDLPAFAAQELRTTAVRPRPKPKPDDESPPVPSRMALACKVSGFLRDDGSTQRLQLPSGTTLNVLRVGTRWVLVDSKFGPLSRVMWSDDDGNTWTNQAWELDDDQSAVSPILLGGKALIPLPRRDNDPTLFGMALFPIDTAPPVEPPAPVLIDLDSVNETCTGAIGSLRMTLPVPSQPGGVVVQVDGKKGATTLAATKRLVHGLANGKTCTSAYELTSDHQVAIIYSGAAGWSGWRFRRSENQDTSLLTADPISCHPQPD